MTIGIEIFLDKADYRIDKMLIQPFRNTSTIVKRQSKKSQQFNVK